jgi:hypothetical protein
MISSCSTILIRTKHSNAASVGKLSKRVKSGKIMNVMLEAVSFWDSDLRKPININ